ncbi:hypothetical protein C0992_012950 [Termitomyces sp. T32_za158]|nr:hypothetical protein C0992_012950 [Termitomyces sp. T32_za158]
MKLAITLSVEELCSIAPDVCNQMKTAVTPKRTMQATIQDADDINNTLPGFTLSALPPNADDPVAKATSVDPVETYFKLLAPEDDHAILTITQDSQAIRSIMLMVDNKSEVEAIVNSGWQIISMSADVANKLGIIYDPAIHLNMQSINGTVDWLLGLAKNVESTADLDPEVLSPSPTTSANTLSQNTSLTQLTHTNTPFEFSPDQLNAQKDLVKALQEAKPLVPINYTSADPIILAVDTSYITVGFYLCVHNLIVEVDAWYIQGMLQNPDIQPSASMNQWVVAILMFHFELVHVKGTFHGPDGLSQQPPQPGDPPKETTDNNAFEDWIDRLHGFMHLIQLPT